MHQYGPLVGRVLLALLFLISGLGILANLSGTAGYYAALGIPLAMLVVILVIVVKLAGSLMVITGIHAREGAWALIGFTLLTILIAHTGEGQMINALKNLSIIGGLLLVALHGAGPKSLHHKCPCPKCKVRKAGVSAAGGVCNCGNCAECKTAKGESHMKSDSE